MLGQILLNVDSIHPFPLCDPEIIRLGIQTLRGLAAPGHEAARSYNFYLRDYAQNCDHYHAIDTIEATRLRNLIYQTGNLIAELFLGYPQDRQQAIELIRDYTFAIALQQLTADDIWTDLAYQGLGVYP